MQILIQARQRPLPAAPGNDDINQLTDGFQLLRQEAETAVKLRLSAILTVLY